MQVVAKQSSPSDTKRNKKHTVNMSYVPRVDNCVLLQKWDGYASLEAAALLRAGSGQPSYLSDKPGNLPEKYNSAHTLKLSGQPTIPPGWTAQTGRRPAPFFRAARPMASPSTQHSGRTLPGALPGARQQTQQRKTGLSGWGDEKNQTHSWKNMKADMK